MGPDIRHIRKFGALVYVHIPVPPDRRKHYNHAKIGLFWVMLRIWWVARYIFVNEHTSQFVTDLRAAEIILYRDLHDIALVDDALPLLHFDDDEDDALAQSLMD